jgi:ribosomal protein L9
MQLENREQNQKTAFRPLSVVAGFVLILLMGAAVASTASAAQLSFQAGELQKQEHQLKLREQYLQEKLAEAQSISTLSSFASENGFTVGSRTVASLDLAPALAHLP